MRQNADIGVVLVTFNRLAKLKKTLQYYEEQTVHPQYIIVVNNASTDGTNEFLDEWQREKSLYERIVDNLPENVGGSGGYYAGEKHAMTLPANWIMVADDDAYPAPDYIEGMNDFIEKHSSAGKIAVVCGSVIERGVYALWHRRFKNDSFFVAYTRPVMPEYYDLPSFELNYASYVGPVMNKSALQEVGLVDKDFFILHDDMEHMQRLGKYGKMYCIPRYRLNHDAEVGNYRVSWKDYYGLRNELVLMKRHFPMHYPLILLYRTAKAILCPLKGRSLAEMKFRLTAIGNSVIGHLGVHPVYRPGWSLKK